ncbi:MAG: hypothetical protein KAU01_11400 [Candidatus Cloacimonetes bacterium]|nr:hypothetical protein [Candidatus Cloacimonadota bacterium]
MCEKQEEKKLKKTCIFRILNIMVEKRLPMEEAFCPIVSAALHEYADAIKYGRAGNRAVEEYRTKNGCTVRTIYGHSESIISQ